MKRIVKWLLIVIGSLLLIVVAAAILIPVLFKDDIKKAIDEQLAKSVNADVLFESDKFSLSLFRHFPNVTAGLKDFGVVNREPFAGEILFATSELEVEINLADILFGNTPKVKGITLVSPVVNILVLEDGRANYDIAIPSTDTTSTEESSEFSFQIEKWQVTDADIVYDDKSLPYYLKLKGLDHTGSGNFTQDVFDLVTHSKVDSVTTKYDGMTYLENKQATVDAVITISEGMTRYAFKDNEATVNDFKLHFEGFFQMNENDYGMDITFGSPDNSFKSLLSLVPGIYTESFSGIETQGELAFNGLVKGTYSDTQMPAFNVALDVKDAMFKYPDLPTPVTNINLNLKIDNKDGVIENTVVDLSKFHMDFGSNPFDARLLIKNLRNYDMDAALKATLNLGELSKMFPLEGMEMKGTYAVDVQAKGVYDSVRQIIPAVKASMSLREGYVKSSEFPIPLEKLNFNSTVVNNSGSMEETVIKVENFSMLMENETFTADLLLENLVDYRWVVNAKGAVDLEKMTRIFPLEGMKLKGKAAADLHTQGRYSDLQAERYDRLPTSGSASLSQFEYTADGMPYAVAITSSKLSFDPRRIELTGTSGTIGRSDFAIEGSVLNYLGYVFGKGETIKGTLKFSSNYLDLNEFMTTTEETATEDTTSYGVIPVPKDIDFVLQSSLKRVRYMDLDITNAAGEVVIRDGVANLNGLNFNMLGGRFALTGAYDTRDIENPQYNFGLKIENLSFQQAAQSFTLVQSYAPVAGLVNGSFGTDFKISGKLLQNMSPDLKSVNAQGLLKIAQASLSQSKLVNGITSLTKLENTDQVTLKDVAMSAEIKNGRLSVKPFDVRIGDYKSTIAGSTGIDGSIDYLVKMTVPAGKLGAQFQSFINENTGAKNSTEEIPVSIAIGNTFKDPSFSLLADEQKKQVTTAATNVAKEEGQKAVQQAVKGTEAEKLVNDLLGGSKDSTQVKSDTTKTTPEEDIKKKVEEDARKKIQNLLKKKN